MRHRIAFVLPTFTTKAVGGYKIIKGYATRLSAMGFDCHIIYVYNVVPSEQGKICSSNFMAYCQNYLRYLHHKHTTTTAYTEHYYYNYAKIAKHHFVAIFATLVFTAFAVVKALPKHCGEKFYFIQGFENWLADDNIVLDSWRLGLNNIVISRWLYNIGKQHAITSYYLPNGLESDKFF